MNDPAYPIPPHPEPPVEKGQAELHYLTRVTVTVDLDTREVLSVVVDDQSPMAGPVDYDPPWDYEGPGATMANAHAIAAEYGDQYGWPEWEVG